MSSNDGGSFRGGYGKLENVETENGGEKTYIAILVQKD